jgi:hypothetical protein
MWMNMASMKWITAFFLRSSIKFKGGPVGLTTIATAVGKRQVPLKKYMNHS